MALMSGAQALVEGLKANRVDTLFALPGVQLDQVFDALHRERGAIRVITSRHEQGAAYMAYGFAESTGRPGVFLVVPGPGLLNTATAVCTAHASNAPVIALAGQIATRHIGRGMGVLHEVDRPEAMFAPITGYQALADHAGAVVPALNRCIARAMSGRRVPVLLQIPDDVSAQRTETGAIEPATPEPDPAPDPELIEKASKVLGEAKAPALFVGGGAFGAEAPLLQLAEMLQAPVIMTRHGRGALSDRHYLAHTLLGGHALWPSVDTVLVVGSRFQEGEQWGLAGLRIVRIDIDAVQAERPASPEIKLVAGARTCLEQLLARVPAHNRRRQARESELRALQKTARAKLAVLAPQKEFSDAVRAALPDEGIVVADITQVGFYTWMGFPAYQPRTLIYPGYQDSLGYGYATALGVKVAHPQRPVVAVCGDGGFLFTMPEMASAVKHHIPLVAVIFNDGAFGNVRRTQSTQFEGRLIGSDLANPDFMKLADAFGVLGLRATSGSELRTALEKALGANAPALIEVPAGPMPAWQPVLPRARVR